MAIRIYKERVHSCELVPFSYYESSLPDYFTSVPLHWHKEFELNYILSGQGEFICGDDRFHVHKGDIIVLQPDVLHAVYQIDDTVILYDTLVFHSDMITGACNDRSSLEILMPLSAGSLLLKPVISRENSQFTVLEECVKEIFIHVKNNTSLDDIMLKSELLRFFAILAENNEFHTSNQTNTTKSEMIRPAIEYIHGHFSENITIEQLAGISHMSKSYFMGCFKNTAGIGAIEYINQIRINAVCELLRTDNRNISELAFACGFSNLANFNRQFKRQIRGITEGIQKTMYITGNLHKNLACNLN